MTLRVLIVDDTVTYRSIMKETLSVSPFIEIVGAAKHGQQALDLLAKDPVDLILLDVEMPVMDGITTLKAVKRQYPKTDVVMVSGVDSTSANITIRALEAGALDFVTKPDKGSMTRNIEHLRSKLLPIAQHLHQKRSSTVGLGGLKPSSVQMAQPAPQPAIQRQPRVLSSRFLPEMICIGVSTGGPSALKQVIPKLPGNLNIPVAVTIHMPEMFTRYLADSLDKESALRVKEAEHMELVEKNTVYIAPGGKHLVFEKNTDGGLHCILNQDPPENSCRPAVDVMFRSAANIYPHGVLAIVLTGMGNDGMRGVQSLKQSGQPGGHWVISQSQQTCTVYGMPKAIDDANLSDESLDLVDIAPRILTLTRHQKVNV